MLALLMWRSEAFIKFPFEGFWSPDSRLSAPKRTAPTPTIGITFAARSASRATSRIAKSAKRQKKNYWQKKPKEKKQKETYKTFLEYSHDKTGNKIIVYTDRSKIDADNDDTEYSFFLPNITIKFFPSWDNQLSYEEVVNVVNCIVPKYNIAFNLSEFHVAIDLFSDLNNNYIHDLAGCCKSSRIYDPDEDSKFPGTYYFQSRINPKYPLRLIMYDKKKEILDKGKRISNKSLKELLNVNVTRTEAKVYNTVMGMVSSMEALAKYCFVDLYPKHIQFLEPDESKLIKHGIEPIDYEGLRLKELRQFLREEGIKNNFFYYTKDN